MNKGIAIKIGLILKILEIPIDTNRKHMKNRITGIGDFESNIYFRNINIKIKIIKIPPTMKNIFLSCLEDKEFDFPVWPYHSIGLGTSNTGGVAEGTNLSGPSAP